MGAALLVCQQTHYALTVQKVLPVNQENVNPIPPGLECPFGISLSGFQGQGLHRQNRRDFWLVNHLVLNERGTNKIGPPFIGQLAPHGAQTEKIRTAECKTLCNLGQQGIRIFCLVKQKPELGRNLRTVRPVSCIVMEAFLP